MRWNGCLLSIALATVFSASSGLAATFGTVVPIGGHASDIALDEGRGILYVANFTANRIEVMSTADYTIHSSMNVAPQPGAIALSPDGKYLIVAHYGNITPADPSRNAVTLINLDDNTRQTFTTGDTPLAVTFLSNRAQTAGLALVVTTTSFLVFDPISGSLTSSTNFGNVAKVLPANLDTTPGQVVAATITTNPTRTVAFAMADSGSAQAFYRIEAASGQITGAVITAVPRPLPRLSVSADGTWAMAGLYRITAGFDDIAQFPNATSSPIIGGNVIDPNNNVIWAQIVTLDPTAAAAGGVAGAITGAPAAPAQPPTLMQLDPDNLYVRESYRTPENIVGRMVLSANSDMLYAVSDSGVMVFPIGRMNQQNRVAATVSDLVARSTFCNRNVIVQTLNITDPGGGRTADFVLTTNGPGVTISPATGRVPATVQVRIDPTFYQDQNGTAAITLNLGSSSAINVPPPVRLLINNRNPDQRGTFFNVAGTLTDLLSDPVRNRFYVVAQDRDLVLVFDSVTYQQIAALKTSATPTQIAFTSDRQYLLIGHDGSQQAWVYDLNSLQQQQPIQFPPGHYPRSIAESGKSMLALCRNVTSVGGPGVIDRIDFNARRAAYLPSLGIYSNSLDAAGVLAPSPNGASILVAMPDGNVMLYDANADTFTISRQDFKSLGGAYAASSYNSYVVGNVVLNASLVPAGTLESASGAPSGFAFIDQGGFRTMHSSAAGPGVIERFASNTTGTATRMAESPLMPTGFQKFIRSVAPLYDRSGIIALTVSGFTVLPWSYDAAVAPPEINSVVNAADGTKPVAPGGLISIYGQQMAPVNLATKEIPLPTALADSCLTVNGVPVPVLFVSSTQINGQLPFSVDGNASMTLRTPGGISDNFNFSILPAAPSIFRTGSAGSVNGLATITRADNGEYITPTNPVHPGDSITIWATGLGRTSPPIDSGVAAPSDPLPSAVIVPTVTLGGATLNVEYAGLVPGAVGLYQINAKVPGSAPLGLEIPLVVNQGGVSTALSVRVVK